MQGLPMGYGLALAAILFTLGLAGLVVRRNMLFMLMCLEIMLNAAGLAFIVAGSHQGSAEGQSMFILIIAYAGAEASVGLGLLIQLFNRTRDVDVTAASEMNG